METTRKRIKRNGGELTCADGPRRKSTVEDASLSSYIPKWASLEFRCTGSPRDWLVRRPSVSRRRRRVPRDARCRDVIGANAIYHRDRPPLAFSQINEQKTWIEEIPKSSNGDASINSSHVLSLRRLRPTCWIALHVK